MKFLKWIIIIFFVGIIGLISAIFIYLQSSRPVYHGELHGRGVQEDVKVFFDHYKIPHIYATNERDAFFTLGYIHAQERLFQMEMLRRVGSGRLAEVLGRDFVEVDAFFRTLGIAKSAREAAAMFFSKPSEPWQKNTLAYIKGVNSFMFNGATPPEFIILGIPKTAFTPEDVYLITGYMAFSFAEGLRTDPILDKIAHRHGPAYLSGFMWKNETESDTVIVPDTLHAATSPVEIAAFIDRAIRKLPVKPWIGSNGWVLAPSRSKSGNVMMANDTHIGYQQPSVWYEAHVEYPGNSLYGNFLAGIPYPLLGHNRNVSWGLTMFENDDMNLYREKRHPVNPDSYLHKDVWENFRKSTETIRIRDAADTVITVRESVHGPVINDVVPQLDSAERTPVSLWWTYTRFPISVLQFTHQLSNARGIDDARKAAAMVHAPGLNILYGDVKGNIALWSAAKLPAYRPGLQTKLILDGSTGADDIQGFYDFEHNPQLENPPGGVIVSANNKPQPKAGYSYPGYYAPGYRYERIHKLLESQAKWGLNEIEKISVDVISDAHPRIANAIMSVIGDDAVTKTSPTHERVSRLLRNWNGSHLTTDTTPTIYYRLLSTILEMAMADELGADDFNTLVNTHLMKNSYETFLGNDSLPWWDNTLTAERENRRGIFIEAFARTIKELQASSGDITNWTWGGVHTLEHVHPIGKQKPLDKIFNIGPYAIKGGIETINNAGFLLNTSGKYPVTYGPAVRILLDMNDIDNGWNILPTGVSGHVRSPHYRDQSGMHREGEFRLMMMNKDQIQTTCTSILTFKAQ